MTNDQTISCKTDWRLLVSLWRTDPMYHELKESHSSYESVHDWWRDRYKVAADDIGIRPKVRGIHWHRLRANVAGLVEWLRICLREGWLASARRNHGEAKRGFQERGELIAGKLANMRVRMGVARAYGQKALEPEFRSWWSHGWAVITRGCWRFGTLCSLCVCAHARGWAGRVAAGCPGVLRPAVAR